MKNRALGFESKVLLFCWDRLKCAERHKPYWKSIYVPKGEHNSKKIILCSHFEIFIGVLIVLSKSEKRNKSENIPPKGQA